VRTFRICLGATLSIVLVTGPANSQPGATDNELYAAYCEGALRESLQIAQTQPHVADPAIPKGMQDRGEQLRLAGLAQITQQHERFLSYLFATGALPGLGRPGVALGILSAENQGAADEDHAIHRHAQCSDAIFGAPGTPPRNQGAAGWVKLTRCQDADPVVRKVLRCLGPDNLPY